MFSFPDAARLLGVCLQFPEPTLQIQGASIDTRTLQPGNLFVALRGQKQDGHQFLPEAFAKGASGAVLSAEFFSKNSEKFSGKNFRNLLPVPDPAQALVDLAKGTRAFFKIKAVGITGSVGKTSTKEFLAFLLSKKFKVLATAGNFNNHLGLPLTLFRLRSEHEICIAELGANHPGEIRFLGEVLKPQAAVITRIAPVHVEGFGSLEKIYEAKSELLEALAPGSFAVLPDDDPVLVHRAERLKLKPVLVGESFRAHYRISEVRTENGSVHFRVQSANKKYSFSFPGMAAFLVKNAAMAAATAENCGLPLAEIPQDWSGLQLPSGRFEMQAVGPCTFIFDGYNASPAAFDAALGCFAALKTDGCKWVAFSDMLELGPEEKLYHERLGARIAALGLASVSYGPRARWACDIIRKSNPSLPAEHFETAGLAACSLEAKLRAGDAVLLKASRGMRIEEILNFFKRKYEKYGTGSKWTGFKSSLEDIYR